jgi:hypothetical protein
MMLTVIYTWHAKLWDLLLNLLCKEEGVNASLKIEEPKERSQTGKILYGIVH